MASDMVARLRSAGLAATAAIALAVPQAGAAQVLLSDQAGVASEARATLGIVIPLGRAGSDAERAPRFELAFDQRRFDDRGFSVFDPALVRRTSSARLGFTLMRKPQLMLNGRAMPDRGERHNLSTLAWVGIGLGAVLVAGVVATKEALDCDFDEECN